MDYGKITAKCRSGGLNSHAIASTDWVYPGFPYQFENGKHELG
jgi:hypothetical protein